MDNVTRLTIVNDKGLILEDWNISALHLDIQDEGRTLKVFYTKGITMTDSLHDRIVQKDMPIHLCRTVHLPRPQGRGRCQ